MVDVARGAPSVPRQLARSRRLLPPRGPSGRHRRWHPGNRRTLTASPCLSRRAGLVAHANTGGTAVAGAGDALPQGPDIAAPVHHDRYARYTTGCDRAGATHRVLLSSRCRHWPGLQRVGSPPLGGSRQCPVTLRRRAGPDTDTSAHGGPRSLHVSPPLVAPLPPMHARRALLNPLRVFPARELHPSPGSAIVSLRDANALRTQVTDAVGHP